MKNFVDLTIGDGVVKAEEIKKTLLYTLYKLHNSQFEYVIVNNHFNNRIVPIKIMFCHPCLDDIFVDDHLLFPYNDKSIKEILNDGVFRVTECYSTSVNSDLTSFSTELDEVMSFLYCY